MYQRRRFRQTMNLSDRLNAEATRLRDMAEKTLCATEKEVILLRAAEYEAAMHMEGYLRSGQLSKPI